MGVEAVAVVVTPTTPTTPTLACVCGERAAVKVCDACALQYCNECSVRRHRHGAFARHTVQELTTARTNNSQATNTNANESVAFVGTHTTTPTLAGEDRSVQCDECGDRTAVTLCGACELRFCAVCLAAVHQLGTMQTHGPAGRYVDVGQGPTTADEPPHRHVTHAVDKLLQDDYPTTTTTTTASTNSKSLASSSLASSLKHTSSPYFASVGHTVYHPLDAAATDHATINDPDQELSPTPLTKTSSVSDNSSTASSSSYDLWGSWSVRSYTGDRSSLTSPPPLSGSTDWRAFRSLSIDASPTSPRLSLNPDDSDALAKSLRVMSFAATNEERAPQPTKRTPRPRSFSDYTSLGAVKLNDIWNERVPQLQLQTPTPTALRPPTPAAVVGTPSVGDELYRSMTTTVASRHVIIRSHAGAFHGPSLRRVLDTLTAYGPIASIREEFTSDGVLFCTFFQLKAAIGAVKLWFTNNQSRANATANAHETSAVFSVPYETPNDINCATLLVQLHGPTVMGAVNDIRQICARYGEVASVLERDGDERNVTPFLVEFNDARDVATALSSLSGVLLSSGHMITASRSHPPTFDMTKIQAFQECVDAVSTQKAMPSFTNRPKSFSESTSILTSPSSTSSSSPLHGSFFETRSSGFRQMTEMEAEFAGDRNGLEHFNESNRSESHFTSSLATTGSAWPRVREAARPRSSSAFASLSSDSSSSLLADAFASSPARPSRYVSQHSAPYRPLSNTPSGSSHHSLNPHALMMQGRLGPIRSGSDPGFRASYAASIASSTTSSMGRNDQGTGEYSLSIDKVAAGDDTRTTLMVRNIPNKYTQQMLLAEINAHHHGQYDFFYLPIDFKNKCNMGYAFINFIAAASIVSFYQEFDSQKWTNFNSEKVCAISYARLQGKQAMITRFQNSSLLDKHESYRPLVFYSSGPHQGTPEPFPSPKLQPQPQHHPHHQTQGFPSFATKKLHHQHPYPHQHAHHQHPQMLSDEYLLAAHSGRLYAPHQQHQEHQQHQQLHHAARVLHNHALLANAHAAAAAMLHTMPNLGIQQAPQYASPRAAQYGQSYQHHQHHAPSERRYSHPYVNMPASRGPAPSAFGSFSGATYSSPSPQS